jgi:PTS system ascorbate-specific IIA component
MSVGLLLITHGQLGPALLKSATEILGCCPLPAKTLEAPSDCNPETIFEQALVAAKDLDEGDGILVLTDLFGSTPSNISCRLQQFHKANIIAGLNLPMLVRVLNYPSLHIDELTHKAISGGRDGVMLCKTRIDR